MSRFSSSAAAKLCGLSNGSLDDESVSENTRHALRVYHKQTEYLWTGCCREAADKCGLTPSVNGVLTGKKRSRFADSETLPRDSVMEVVGPRVQSGLANVVRGLAEEKLTQFAVRVQTRILQNALVTEDECTQWAVKQKQKYKTFVESNSSFFEGFLKASGLAGTFDMQQLIAEGNDVHTARNTRLHTDDQNLRKDAKFLQRRGFVEMMKEEMPYQCALVMNLEWILSSTHGKHTFSHAK